MPHCLLESLDRSGAGIYNEDPDICVTQIQGQFAVFYICPFDSVGQYGMLIHNIRIRNSSCNWQGRYKSYSNIFHGGVINMFKILG